MSPKFLILLGVFIGSTVGSYIPAIWGDYSTLSLPSIFFSLVGGAIGIYVGWRMGQDQ